MRALVLLRCWGGAMSGERRLTSIKQLVNDMLLHTDITGIITIDDILNLNVDSLPIVTITHKVGNVSYTSGAISVPNVDTLIIPANPDRKFLRLRRGTTVGRMFATFGAAATTTNGILMRENQITEFKHELVDTREVRAISVGSSKILYWTEAT